MSGEGDFVSGHWLSLSQSQFRLYTKNRSLCTKHRPSTARTDIKMRINIYEKLQGFVRVAMTLTSQPEF
jgi:hypothetical protein